jgi:hypothetical protein
MNTRPPPTHVSSLDDLSAILGTTERQWRSYSKRNTFPPKIPGLGYEVAACAAWKAENVKPQSQGDLAAEKIAKTKLEVELLELKVAKEKRLSVPRAEIDELHGRMAMKLRAFLYSKLINELPPRLAGQDALTIRLACREVADEIVTRLQMDVDSWGAS